MELTSRQRAEKAVTHAIAGVIRARERCEATWADWVSAIEHQRRAMEILAQARNEAAVAVASANERSGR